MDNNKKLQIILHMDIDRVDIWDYVIAGLPLPLILIATILSSKCIYTKKFTM